MLTPLSYDVRGAGGYVVLRARPLRPLGVSPGAGRRVRGAHRRQAVAQKGAAPDDMDRTRARSRRFQYFVENSDYSIASQNGVLLSKDPLHLPVARDSIVRRVNATLREANPIPHPRHHAAHNGAVCDDAAQYTGFALYGKEGSISALYRIHRGPMKPSGWENAQYSTVLANIKDQGENSVTSSARCLGARPRELDRSYVGAPRLYRRTSCAERPGAVATRCIRPPTSFHAWDPKDMHRGSRQLRAAWRSPRVQQIHSCGVRGRMSRSDVVSARPPFAKGTPGRVRGTVQPLTRDVSETPSSGRRVQTPRTPVVRTRPRRGNSG